jgi:two-component sensor histidine kinase/PAS domain-containing protein
MFLKKNKATTSRIVQAYSELLNCFINELQSIVPLEIFHLCFDTFIQDQPFIFKQVFQRDPPHVNHHVLNQNIATLNEPTQLPLVCNLCGLLGKQLINNACHYAPKRILIRLFNQCYEANRSVFGEVDGYDMYLVHSLPEEVARKDRLLSKTNNNFSSYHEQIRLIVQNEERFRTLFESTTLLIFITDLNLAITEVNEYTIALFQCTESDLLNKPLYSIVQPYDTGGVLPSSSSYKAKGLYVYSNHPSRQAIVLELISMPLFEGASPMAHMHIGTDLTQRMTLEKELQHSLIIHETVLDLSQDAIMVTTQEGEVLMHNPMLQDLWHIEPEDEAGSLLEQMDTFFLKDELNHTSFITLMNEVQSNQQSRSLPLIIWLKNGSIFECRYKRVTIPKKIDRWVWFFNDITHQDQTHITLRKQVQTTEMRLKELHHRVKNNMHLLQSIFRLLSNNSDTATQTLIQDVLARMNTMALIHEQLQLTPLLDQVEMATYLDKLINNLQKMLTTNPIPSLIQSDFDSVRLPMKTALPCGLILNELIMNAMKHTKPSQSPTPIRVGFKKLTTDDRYSLSLSNPNSERLSEKEHTSTPSFNLNIVEILCKQLNASLSMDPDGRDITIIIPLGNVITESIES